MLPCAYEEHNIDLMTTTMFVLPALGSISLDVACICLFFIQKGNRAIGSTFQLRVVDVVAFTFLRLVFLTLFATMFYRER